jgi:hypothetical protein
MRKAPTLQIEEIGGDLFPSQEAAWRAALPLIAEHLQAVIRDLIERGELVIDQGKIDVPKPSRYRGNGDPSSR